MHHTKKKKAVALSSVFASAFLTIAKLIVGILTGSLGILSEAVHSALDFSATLLTYFSVKAADKPPDDDHPYGHTKIESVTALIETGLLFVTCAWIFYEAAQRLINDPPPIKTPWYAIALIAFSILIDAWRSHALIKVAKETKSQALEADALHFSSDILSSLAVLIGLALVSLGFSDADTIAAIVVAVFVARVGYNLGKRTIDVLIDTAPAELTEQIRNIVMASEGVLRISRIRIRQAGTAVFIDVGIDVNRTLSVSRLHDIIHRLKQKIYLVIPDADITVYPHVVSLSDETIIEGVQAIAAHHGLSVHDIAVHNVDERIYLSIDLEVDASLVIYEAHDIADRLEAAIHNELDTNLEISTHIEPVKSHIVQGSVLSSAEEEKVRQSLKEISKSIPEIYHMHNIQGRKADGRWFISCHCSFDAKTPLQHAHTLASRFEYLVRQTLPQVERLLVHTEPLHE